MPGSDSGRYLVDKSALARAPRPVVGERLRRLAESGMLVMFSIVDLEVLSSARRREEYDDIADELAGFEHVPIDETLMGRAGAIQRSLAMVGQHRLPILDLIISATAEIGGATVLHYDGDFERIAAITGQPHEWVAEPGSID